jgi:hypothetical protein
MPKPYPPQFRRQALDLVASGRSVRDVAAARRVVPASMEAAGLVVDRGVKPGVTAQESRELAEARRRIRDPEEEVKILRKAAAAVEEVVLPKVRYRLVAELHADGLRVGRACHALVSRGRSPAQRRLVLINSTSAAGASSPPCDTAEANSHGDTASRNPGQRRNTATVAANTAATASANPDPAASGGAAPASTSTARGGEPGPHRPGTTSEPAQPPPHRRRRPAHQHRDQAMPRPDERSSADGRPRQGRLRRRSAIDYVDP